MRGAIIALTLAVAGATLTLLLWLAPAPACAASGCGFKPFKPFTPFGCKDLRAVCRCDSEGKNCVWEWDCVR